MLNRLLAVIAHLIALLLYGIVALLVFPLMLLDVVLVLALGLVSAVGLFGDPVSLLKGDHRPGPMLLGAGDGAWVALMVIFDRLLTSGAFLNGGYRPVSIPASHLHIDFNR